MNVSDYSDLELNELALKCMYNFTAVKQSKICGCFYCKKIFPAADAWYMEENNGKITAFCPYCNVDSVLPDSFGINITYELLIRMHELRFCAKYIGEFYNDKEKSFFSDDNFTL
jgi:hypothetical protein